MNNLDVPVWSNDGKQVCYRGKPVRGIDPKTFEVLLGNYARDAQSVFFHRLKAPVDRETFRVLNANFGVDATQAYFVVSPIRDADPKSFRVLDSSLMAEFVSSFLHASRQIAIQSGLRVERVFIKSRPQTPRRLSRWVIVLAAIVSVFITSVPCCPALTVPHGVIGAAC